MVILCRFTLPRSVYIRTRKPPFCRLSAKSKNSNSSRRWWIVLAVSSASTVIAVSVTTRIYRQAKIQELPIAREVWREYFPKRSPSSVEQIVQRMGLMGKSRSVKAEIDEIRKWHHDNGFKGGIVLRDLTKPLFGMDMVEGSTEQEDWTVGELLQDLTRLARRECYYLYYEVKDDGEIQQQIFCRGTTLEADLLTCFQAWMVYDDELGCKVHLGFRNQANRIVDDVLPLLSPPSNHRGTIAVCGHSLGGAVAAIIAAKLRRRGYRVISLTTVGEPRFCSSREDSLLLLKLLPKDHLRIENEFDFVPFVPPFGSHMTGNKLWLFQGKAARLVPTDQFRWTDSVFVNFLSWEIFSSHGSPHRIPSYIENLKSLVS